MSYSQNVTQPGQRYEIQLPDGSKEIQSFPTGTPYVEFSLLKVPNRQEAERVINIVSKIFQYYMSYPPGKSIRTIQIEKYNDLIPELADKRSPVRKLIPSGISARQTKKQIRDKSEESTSKITLLKRAAPEVFVSGYATDCQKSDQPIPIQEEEIPIWVRKKFIYAGKRRDRQILYYPPMRDVMADPSINKQWKFVCPDDNIPFPGVKKNTRKNKDKYLYVPCCYTKNHMDETANSDYNEYYRGIPTKKVQTKTQQYINKTSKILPSGNYGVVSKNISKFLAINDDPKTVYQVMGMPNTPNSFLDCILTAVKDSAYINMISIQHKIQYARDYRQMLGLRFGSGQFRVELLKQELYDQSSSQIIDGLTNQNLFMDPSLYYRVLEEIHEINIFVFVSKQGNGRNLLDLNQLEIPRHRDFYIKTRRSDRPTVLIYKHQSFRDRGGVETPAQCELIFRKKNNTQFYQYHPIDNSQTIQALFELFYRMTSTIEWDIPEKLPLNREQVIEESNGLNQVNFSSFIPEQYITHHQILDDYGKFRGLAFTYPAPSGDTSQSIIMITPPAQPLNLPIWKGRDVPGHELVITFFVKNKVTGASYVDVKKRLINGLWYQIYDREFGLYFPVKPFIADKPYPVGPDRPLNLLHNPLSKVIRIRGLRKMNHMILNIIKWLFVISQKTQNMSANQFIQSWIIAGHEVGGKSFSKYNLNRVPHRFPKVSDIYQGIQYLSEITEGLIRQNKIYLYSDKYFNSISYFLRDYEKISMGLEIKVPVMIPGRLMDVDDFIANLDNLIFMNKTELQNWLDSLDRARRKNTNIRNTIEPNLTSLIHPYIFTDIDRDSYLIQNAFPGKVKLILPSKKPIQKPVVEAVQFVPEGPTYIPETQYAAPFRLGSELSPTQSPVFSSSSLTTVSSVSPGTVRPAKSETPKEGLPRALKIAQTWKDNKNNPGYYSEMISTLTSFPPYQLYSVSITKLPILKEDKSNSRPNPLKILEYSEGTYAAMLPL